MAVSRSTTDLPVSSELVVEHLGRTGAATPPPSAPRMLSRTARGTTMRLGSAKSFPSIGATSSSMRVFASTGASSIRRSAASSHASLTDGRTSQMRETSYSSTLPSTWRKTWTEAGAFPSPTLRRAEEVVGPERDLSTPARRANRKAEEKMQQYNTAQQSSKRRGNPNDSAENSGYGRSFSGANVLSVSLPGTSKDWEQSFKEDAVELDSLIQKAASNLRLGGVKNQKEREAERDAKLREEQRRQRAAEERAARLQEAAARDPHRKVNLKIENTRKFKWDAVEEMGIPMLQVQFNGTSGMEHVNMVDCLKIRQRCKQINTNGTPSVRSLIDQQTRMDRLYGIDPKTGAKFETASNMGDTLTQEFHEDSPSPKASSPTAKGNARTSGVDNSPHSQSAPSMPRTSLMTSRSSALKLQGDEESKWQRVHKNRNHILVSCMLRRLNTMRSTPTEATLSNLEQIASQGAKEMERSKQGHRQMSIASEPVDLTGELLKKQIRVARSGALAARKKSLTCKAKPKVRLELDEKGHQRARHAWSIARSAVCVLVLHSHIKKKRKAICILKGFLATLGEWSRLRLSMSRLLKNIHILQRACRQFIIRKRQRCEIMSKDWQRIEDQHLQVYFRELAQVAIEEVARQEEIARSKGRVVAHRSAFVQKKKEEMMIMMKENVDWRMYKIPREDRRAILSRYYQLSLMKKVQGRKNLLETVQHVVRLHNETVGFLKQFGAHESHAADLRNMSLQQNQVVPDHIAEFWHLTEDKALDLIAFAAHKLRSRSSNALPWRDHPANMHRQGNRMRRPHLKLGANPDLMCLVGEQPRLSKRGKSAKIETQPQNEDNKDGLPADLDKLWQQFTPRLKEITKDESMNKPSSRTSQRPMSRISNRLGEQDPSTWRI